MTRAGVRTVVAGGRPTTGPMQAASGTRGAAPYDANRLDENMDYASSLDTYSKEQAVATIPDVHDSGIYYTYIGINIRDQVRADDTTPLQFKYEAADCRIYYTMKNLYNMTQLWHDVSTAAFVDSSLCVQGSTGFSTTNNTNPSPPPKPQTQRPTLELDTNTDKAVVDQLESDSDPNNGLRDGDGRGKSTSAIVLCTPSNTCTDTTKTCRRTEIYCHGQGPRTIHACLPSCRLSSPCPGSCLPTSTNDNKIERHQISLSKKSYNGLCFPLTGTRLLGCLRDPPPL